MKPMPSGSFLSRLAQDTYGSTLAIMAAAIIPLIGLIGGGLDMSRIYLTKTRVQQACDAGALSGRKAMGSDSWTTSGATSTRGRAYEMFDANFKTGDYGTGTRTREFTEADGTVNGTATAVVPMTLMRVFGMPAYTVSVSCTAKMEIPNTDVMFVLDVTASMGCAPNDGSCAYDLSPDPTTSKIAGLKSAVKCFYEALLKVNTAEPCSTSPAVDPSATSYTGTAHIRLGFVPYAANVNVGTLLPNANMVDSYNYHSRDITPTDTTTVRAWVANGSPGTPGGWSGWSAAPTNLNAQNTYGGWTDMGTSPATVSINSVTYTKRQNLSETNCNNLNTIGPTGNKMLTYVAGSPGAAGAATETGRPAPTYPNDQTVNYSQVRDTAVTGYKFLYYGGSGTNRCRLQSGTRTYQTQRSGSSTVDVTWTDYERVDTFTYNTRSIDVSSLKSGGSAWSSTVDIPRLTTSNVTGLRLSGSNDLVNVPVAAPSSITWGGCVIEAPTYQGLDNDPSNDWSPIPAAAKDMDINLIPTGTDRWAPLLKDAFWGRYTGTNRDNRTTSLVRTAETRMSDELRNIQEGVITGYDCPTPARKLAEYTTPASFESYIGGAGTGLQATGMGTYHDIGLLWGARLLSPVGIFGSENALTLNGGQIERHLIFMTDGNAQSFNNNLTAYGSAWWDRRQSNYVPANGNATQETELQNRLTNTINARLVALCSQIKNMQITLWVVYYGGDSSEDNEDRLEACATPGHFYTASDTAALKAKFKQIAADISDLRLTQ